MYVDSKPVSTYAETQGWKLPMPSPSPQPPGSLKRPPLLSHGSSSSSLSGMEQAIPSFRSFVNRTPPADQHKPLPPTPLILQRASSTSPPRSRTPSSYDRRRSSSIYSRTASQWFDDDSSWRSADLRDEPMPEMPPLPILQPVAYSKSTPQLIDRPAAPPPQVLAPRAYSPLIITPSPTASRVTTPDRSLGPSPTRSPLRQQHTPVMYPTSPPIHDGPKKQIHTVSLEQAKAAVHSPGAVHLLPEELRAQTLGKSRSHDLIRVPTLMFFEKTRPPELPEPPTLVDVQGRHRSLQGHGKGPDVGSEYPFPVMHAPPLPSPRALQSETDYEKSRAPLETQCRQASKAKAAASLGLDDEEEPRGRTRQRGPRSTDHAYYMPNGKRVQSSPSPDERNDAQKLASEYHNLLSEQYRQPSSSPAYNSDDSIKAHMKMVPQPLFKTKPAAKLPGSISSISSERGGNVSVSPFHSRADSQATGSSQGSLPLRLSLTPDPVHRRTSTSESIPISPPTNLSSASPAPIRRTADSPVQSKKPRPRRKSKDDLVSMYYPYVGPRKDKKAKERKASAAKEGEQPVLMMPLLSADIIAQKLKTPEGSNVSSPLRSTASFNIRSNTSSHRKDSNASSDRQRTPLIQRLAGNAVQYADRITSPSSTLARQTHQPSRSSSTTASPHSPHLLPSPVKSNPPPVHLGWSDSAKTTFDRSRSSWQSAKSPQTPQSAHFTHLPGRPLDESRMAFQESEDSPSPAGRKGSIFGGLLDGWKERKKEERREELKKIIRVVPTGPPPRMRTMDIVPSSSLDPGQGLVRQGSMDTAAPKTEAARPVSGGLARRMSAFGWM